VLQAEAYNTDTTPDFKMHGATMKIRNYKIISSLPHQNAPHYNQIRNLTLIVAYNHYLRVFGECVDLRESKCQENGLN